MKKLNETHSAQKSAKDEVVAADGEATRLRELSESELELASGGAPASMPMPTRPYLRCW